MSQSRSYQHSQGFTLLELMVVLVLMGMVAGVVLPRMSKVYDRVQAAFELEDVRQSLARIPLMTFAANTRYELIRLPSNSNQSLEIPLPQDWIVIADAPIVYQPNGVCLGGNLTVAYKDVKYRFALSAPNCVPRL